MSEHIVHRLVGYDPTTERLAYQHDIPRSLLPMVKTVAHVVPDDPEAIGSYPLEMPEAREIAEIIQIELPSCELAFFLEPFALPAVTRRASYATA